MQSLQAFKGSVGYDATEKTAKNELYNNKNFILVRPTNLWNLQIHMKVIYLKGIGNCSGTYVSIRENYKGLQPLLQQVCLHHILIHGEFQKKVQYKNFVQL